MEDCVRMLLDMAKTTRKQVQITPENFRRLEEFQKKLPMSPTIPKLTNEALRIGLDTMQNQEPKK